MSDTKQCAFCGKPTKENDDICEECRDHVDHQYATDFLDDNQTPNSLDNQIEIGEGISFAPHTEHEPLLNPSRIPAPEEPKRRSKISKGMIFIIAGSVILMIIGVIGALDIARSRKSEATQEAYWVKCAEENTPLAYSKYLIRYPQGNFVSEAVQRIRAAREAEVQEWEKLKKSSDINKFEAYLSNNPKTPHIDHIRQIIDSLSWIATLKNNTADAYKAYLENINLGNITGDHKEEAKEKYDYLSQIVMLSGASLENLKLNLIDFFRKLSDNKPKDLLKEFPAKAFYYTKGMSSTEIVSSISKEYADKKIKKITYSLKPKSVTAKQDNRGIIFVTLSIEKDITYNVKKKKNDQVSQNLLIEMNGDNLVRSIKVRK